MVKGYGALSECIGSRRRDVHSAFYAIAWPGQRAWKGLDRTVSVLVRPQLARVCSVSLEASMIRLIMED